MSIVSGYAINVIPEKNVAFETTFKKAESIISSINSYISHELKRCVEKENRYLLLVKWEKLEDHIVGFRQSPQYQEWKLLLHLFMIPFLL